jgi:hypothetical protein
MAWYKQLKDLEINGHSFPHKQNSVSFLTILKEVSIIYRVCKRKMAGLKDSYLSDSA